MNMKTKSIIVFFFAVILAVLTMALTYPIKIPLLFNENQASVILHMDSMENISEDNLKIIAKGKGVKIEIFVSSKDKKRELKYTILTKECELITAKEIE